MKKMVSRFIPVFVLIVMFVVGALPALAQDGANPLCNGLADADCQLMMAGQASWDGVTSFSVPSYTLDFSMNTGEDEVAVSATGSGEFVLPMGEDLSTLMIHLFVDNGSMTENGDTQTASFEMIVLDGMAYINYDGEWYGDTMSEQDMADFASMGSIADMGSMGDMGGMDMTGVVTTTRAADRDMMGQSVAVFSTTVDINQLLMVVLSSPAIGDIMGQAMGGDTTGMEAMSPEEMQMVGAMLAPMLGDTSLSFEQWIGADDMMLHGVALDANLHVDMSMFSPDSAPITGGLHMEIELGNFNESFSVTAPENYKPADEVDMDLGSITSDLGM